jgi:hypothetical protein
MDASFHSSQIEQRDAGIASDAICLAPLSFVGHYITIQRKGSKRSKNCQ